jgi:nicotinamidase-related amidase
MEHCKPRLAVRASPSVFEFYGDQVALVCIDFQRDFLEPGGFGEALGNDVSLLRSAIPPTRSMLDLFRDRGWTIIHTREGHRADLADLFPAKAGKASGGLGIGDPGPMGRLLTIGEPGHETIPELRPMVGEVVVDKPGKGAFYSTDLETILRARGITHLVVCGVTTEVCVQSTVREANDRGFECLVLEDCTASYFPEFHQSALLMISSQHGTVGKVSDARSVHLAVNRP